MKILHDVGVSAVWIGKYTDRKLCEAVGDGLYHFGRHRFFPTGCIKS